MRARLYAISIAAALLLSSPLRAQHCSVVVNTPEDKLMLEVNGAEGPDEQIAALDKFVQEEPTSSFLPCVNESYTAAYLKKNNYDKAIEYGEKNVALNFYSVPFMTNLLKAYIAGGKVNDSTFEVIAKAADVIRSETAPSRPQGASDADWKKTQDESNALAKDDYDFMAYAFFQLLPRVADANKRIAALDAFSKSYPEATAPAQVALQYFLAYKMAGNAAKAAEFGEKAITLDPSNPGTLNFVADDYITRQANPNPDKASEYAKKVLTIVPTLKKPDTMTDEQWKANVDTQLGYAHMTLGYVDFYKGSRTHHVAPAIQEFKTASELLAQNPELLCRALYYLGYAYEVQYPANHHEAASALGRAAGLQSSFQPAAQDLLRKVKQAMGQ